MYSFGNEESVTKYAKIAEIKIKSNYNANSTILLAIARRSHGVEHLEILFSNSKLADVTIKNFTYYGDNFCYLHKTETEGLWEVYVTIAERYDTCTIYDFKNPISSIVEWTWVKELTIENSLPEGCISPKKYVL